MLPTVTNVEERCYSAFVNFCSDMRPYIHIAQGGMQGAQLEHCASKHYQLGPHALGSADEDSVRVQTETLHDLDPTELWQLVDRGLRRRRGGPAR